MHKLNLGIVAHVDAGKTSLTERLLFAAGVIDAVGSVDAGNTQTDTLSLERQRGITIRAAVVSFCIGDVTVNLVDTPGHPDFIAEVDRALGVLDGAVLVISAVEGVQAQTRVLFRALQRLGIPAILFVNKVDRAWARSEALVADIREKLTPSVVAMGTVERLGTRQAHARPFAGRDPGFVREALDVLAVHDPALLARFVEDEASVAPVQVRRSLERHARAGRVYPLFFGSAITGTGTAELMAAIPRYLPRAKSAATAPLSAAVFKVERGPGGEKLAIARVFAGSLAVREMVSLGDGDPAKVTSLRVFANGGLDTRDHAEAGDIVQVGGLARVRIGDSLGIPPPRLIGQAFNRPTLETVVAPRSAGDSGRLHAVLTQLAEQDPLINLRHDEERHELSLSLYGEVQKEVIQATLATEFGVEAEFRESTIIHIERPIGIGAAAEFKRVPPNPFLATVGLRVEPLPEGAGVVFELSSAVLGTMPLAFFKAVEDTVHRTLRQGLLGWQVTDCLVTMTHSGYAPRQSHAHQKFSKSMSSTGEDFRGLTPLVLMAALAKGGTAVCEPFDLFRLEAPAEVAAALAPVLAHRRAVTSSQQPFGTRIVFEGELPAAEAPALQRALPGLASGEAVLELSPGAYHPVRGDPPSRARWDDNPLNRKEYLLHVQRRT